MINYSANEVALAFLQEFSPFLDKKPFRFLMQPFYHAKLNQMNVSLSNYSHLMFHKDAKNK